MQGKETDRSKAVLLFLILFVICVCLCYTAVSVHCSLRKGYLLALLCVMFSCVFVIFPPGVVLDCSDS